MATYPVASVADLQQACCRNVAKLLQEKLSVLDVIYVKFILFKKI